MLDTQLHRQTTSLPDDQTCLTFFFFFFFFFWGGGGGVVGGGVDGTLVAQWVKHWPTDLAVPSSSPA